MTEKNKDALPTIHYKDLKHLSDMIDNIVYLYHRRWTKDRRKRCFDVPTNSLQICHKRSQFG